MTGKKLPYNLEAEADIIGMLLCDMGEGSEERREDVFVELTASDFYAPEHREVFSACLMLWKNRKPVDFTTVYEVLDKGGKLDKVGGTQGLTQITGAYLSSVQYRSRIDIIKANSAGRRAIEVARALEVRANENPNAAIEEASRQLADIGRTKSAGLERIDGIAESTRDYLCGLRNGTIKLDGVDTPYRRLNRTLQNFRNGNTVVIAARPGIGKSAFLNEIVLHNALKRGKKVALFSLEMCKREIATRMYSNLLKVSTYELSGPNGPDLSPAFQALKCAELYVNDTTGAVEEVVQACRVQKRRRGLDMVCIDHIGLMTTKSRQKDRRLEIEYISRQLKLLAMELDIPVVILCQMNRAIEYTDREPVLADLRECGAIEQDASQVIFLHRLKGKEETLGYRVNVDRFLELVVAKNRNGAIGIEHMKFECDKMRFIEVDKMGAALKPEAKQLRVEDLEPMPAGSYDPFANDYVSANSDDPLFGGEDA